MSESQGKDITEEELKYAKIYFISGFFCLPMVWLLVIMNWWGCRKSNKENAKKMQFYVNSCLIGCIIWAIIFVVWVIVFQVNWKTVPFFRSIQMMNPEGMAWQ